MAVVSPISRRRRCTDLPCLLVFLAFLVGWLVVAGFAISQGSITRFTMPSDSDDNICGVDKGVKTKPYLLFFDLTKCAYATAAIFGCPTPQMCVEKCPDSPFFGAVPGLLSQTELHPLVAARLKASLRYCLPGVNRTRLTYARLVDGYHCAPWYVSSSPVAGRCLPASIADAVTQLKQLSRAMHLGLAGTEARFLSQPGRQIRLLLAPHISVTNTSTPVSNGTNTTQQTGVTLPGVPETSDGDSITKRVLRVSTYMLQPAQEHRKAERSNLPLEYFRIVLLVIKNWICL